MRHEHSQVMRCPPTCAHVMPGPKGARGIAATMSKCSVGLDGRGGFEVTVAATGGSGRLVIDGIPPLALAEVLASTLRALDDAGNLDRRPGHPAKAG